ncbi:ABC transporter substrate-binding protein [Rhodopila sp.]|uniref:ABC transporter substrate-binding protein n=1 Tax=Rhodopila sp. TaxID=2480087 RepID=UPI002BE1DA28|nr:ABC transporter substrate-binding protein [Rhodopila sp.]HVZ07375.1 ABC transporter substrate-binding protein [Rhodopila sp.]
MLRRRTLLASATAAALPLPSLARGDASKVLTFTPQAGLSTLDPIWTTAAIVGNHGYLIFDTLYGIDSKVRAKPQMAAGHTVSDDGRTWTIRLREGLKFHDNEPVRAVDCAASLRRWSARDPFGQTLAQAVDDWVATDDRTLTVKLRTPFPMLPDALARAASNAPFIMPERLAKTDPNTQVKEMIGSGPFRFLADEFNPGSRSVYTRFDGYVPRQEPPEWTSGGKVAHFERVEWQTIPDAATASAALQTGDVDWWEQVQPDLVAPLRKINGIVVGQGDPLGYVAIIRFNCQQKPFDNPKLRHAVMMAVNQADYMAPVTGNDPSAWRACHAMFPCGTPLGDTPSPDPMARNDVVRAKAAVEAAGYNGEKILIINPSDFSTIEPLGQVTYATLKELGMNVELVETDWASVVQRRVVRSPVDQGGWSIFHTWWLGVTVLNPVTNSFIRGQGDKGWFGWYNSPPAEELVARWVTAPTEAERASLAMQLQMNAFDNAPSIPVGQFFIRTAWRDSLKGIVEGPGAFFWNVRRV